MQALLQSHGIQYREMEPGKYAIECPWMAEHSNPTAAEDSDTVVWESDGERPPGFKCLHDHCLERHWTEFAEKLGDVDQHCRDPWQPEPKWPVASRNGNGTGDKPAFTPEELEKLLKAAADATGEDRLKLLREFAAAIPADPLTAEAWSHKVRDAGLASKPAFLSAVKQAEQQKAAALRREPPPPRDTSTLTEAPPVAQRYRIDVSERELCVTAGEAWEAIHKANDPPVVFRSGGLAARIETDDSGHPFIRTLNEDRMRHHLARVAAWYTWNEKRGEEVPELPPLEVVKDVLATPNPRLPILTSIVEAPVFGPNGKLQTTPGYHSDSQTYYAPAPGLVVPPVSLSPTESEIQRARELIVTELLGDFPFTGDAERSHTAAALLLPFMRGLIPKCTPLHLIEKPSPGTGASLLADAITFPSTGYSVAAMPEGRDEDEWRKRITAKLRTGSSVVLIDNVRRRMDSGILSAALTATTWEDRLLGSSEMLRMPVRCMWLATGNNPALSSEMTRRTVRIRLDARQDRPWLRSEFRHPDLRSWAEEHRGELIWAALTLGRAWLAAGRPLQRKPLLGMFEGWSGVMGGILQVAGIPGFLTNLDDFYQNTDTEGAMWRAFVLAWWEHFGEKEVGVSDLFDLADAIQPPLELGDGSEKSQKIRLGKMLVGMRDRRFDFDLPEETLRTRIVAGGIRQRAQQWSLRRLLPSDVNTVNECEYFSTPAHAQAESCVYFDSESQITHAYALEGARPENTHIHSPYSPVTLMDGGEEPEEGSI